MIKQWQVMTASSRSSTMFWYCIIKHRRKYIRRAVFWCHCPRLPCVVVSYWMVNGGLYHMNCPRFVQHQANAQENTALRCRIESHQEQQTLGLSSCLGVGLSDPYRPLTTWGILWFWVKYDPLYAEGTHNTCMGHRKKWPSSRQYQTWFL